MFQLSEQHMMVAVVAVVFFMLGAYMYGKECGRVEALHVTLPTGASPIYRPPLPPQAFGGGLPGHPNRPAFPNRPALGD